MLIGLHPKHVEFLLLLLLYAFFDCVGRNVTWERWCVTPLITRALLEAARFG